MREIWRAGSPIDSEAARAQTAECQLPDYCPSPLLLKKEGWPAVMALTRSSIEKFSGLCCRYSAAVNQSSPDLCEHHTSKVKQLSESACVSALLWSNAVINSSFYLSFALPLFMSGKIVQSLFLIMCFLQGFIQRDLGSVLLCKNRGRRGQGGERAAHPPYLIINLLTSDRDWKNETLLIVVGLPESTFHFIQIAVDYVWISNRNKKILYSAGETLCHSVPS